MYVHQASIYGSHHINGPFPAITIRSPCDMSQVPKDGFDLTVVTKSIRLGRDSAYYKIFVNGYDSGKKYYKDGEVFLNDICTGKKNISVKLYDCTGLTMEDSVNLIVCGDSEGDDEIDESKCSQYESESESKCSQYESGTDVDGESLGESLNESKCSKYESGTDVDDESKCSKYESGTDVDDESLDESKCSQYRSESDYDDDVPKKDEDDEVVEENNNENKRDNKCDSSSPSVRSDGTSSSSSSDGFFDSLF